MHLHDYQNRAVEFIHRPIRSMLGINTGDEVIFEMEKNKIVLNILAPE